MFKYGGPIKEGVMHGMKNGGTAGVGHGLVGDQRYPKTGGREHHALPLVGLGAAALRFLPAAYRGFKASRAFAPWAQNLGTWGRIKNMFAPSKGIGIRMGAPGEGAGFRFGSLLRSNPATALTLGGLGGTGAAKLFRGSEPDSINIRTKPGVPGGGDPGMYYEAPPKTKSAAELAAEAKAARTAKLNKYLDTMGYDKAKKTAIGDALIDASAIVQQGTEEGGSLKHANWSKMINQAIQATSKRLKKPEQIREAIGLMMTKAEIQKDLTAETDAQAKRKLNLQIKELEAKLNPSAGDIALAMGDKTITQPMLENIVRSNEGVDTLRASFKDEKESAYGKWKDDNKKGDAMKFMNDIVKKDAEFGAGFYVFPKRIVEVKDDLSMSYYY